MTVRGILPTVLLFDLDGTLVDSRQDLANAVNRTRLDFFLEEVDVKQVIEWVGDGVHRLLQRAFPGFDAKTVYQRFLAHYEHHLCDHTVLYPGVKRLLDHAGEHILAVVTNKGQRFTEPLLESLGIRERFDAIIGARPGMPLKPDPAPLRLALDRMNVTSAEAVMIGDSLQDIQAGKNAKVATCAVTWGFRSETQLAIVQPDWMVSHPDELTAMLRSVRISRD